MKIEVGKINMNVTYIKIKLPIENLIVNLPKGSKIIDVVKILDPAHESAILIIESAESKELSNFTIKSFNIGDDDKLENNECYNYIGTIKVYSWYNVFYYKENK